MGKKLLFVDANKSISFDENNYYLDNKPQLQEKADIERKAKDAAAEAISSMLKSFSSAFMNVAVLTAAGTSKDNGEHAGKTREGLWNACSNEIGRITESLKENEGRFKNDLKKACDNKDIEEFLSIIILYEKLFGDLKDDKGKSLIVILQKKIKDLCNLSLDDDAPHSNFLRRLTARKPSNPRVQLYTTNYDTLFEQAAQKAGITVIDGFSFTSPRTFNGKNFDYDIVYRERSRIKPDESFIPNVIQLFKVHGSVDWAKDGDKILQKENVDNPCIIYPASNKYESSYEQPYIELLAHFQQTLRKEGTLLIVVGYGFKDKHINGIIKEAVEHNSHFHLLIVCYGKKKVEGKDNEYEDTGIICDFAPDFIKGEDEELHVPGNVTVLFSTFKDFVEAYPINAAYVEEDHPYYLVLKDKK